VRAQAKHLQGILITLRTFDNVVLHVPEGAAVPDLQIALRSSDIDLKFRVVVLAAFNLNGEQ
jgi:hypothetical protein